MRCRFGHSHPPQPLKAAKFFKGPCTPYHCPECQELTRSVVRQTLHEFPNALAARNSGSHFFGCSRCFPPNVRSIQPAPDPSVYHRRIRALLDSLEVWPYGSTRDPITQISILERKAKIPSKTAAQMFVVTVIGERLRDGRWREPAERQTLMAAWIGLVKWAAKQGLNIEASESGRGGRTL